jgi:hypothetical protein
MTKNHSIRFLANIAMKVSLTLIAVITLGCEPSVDRGQSKRSPIAPAGAPKQQTFDTIPEGGSQSSFGKSRDAAVRLKEKMEARDAEIGQMADDLIKSAPAQTAKKATPELPPNTSPMRP